MKYPVNCEDRKVRLICGRVSVSGGDPAVAAGDGFTLVDVAAGQVKVLLNSPGRELLSAVATVQETTDATAHSVKVDAIVSTSSEYSVTFGVYVADAVDGALVDNVGFHFMIAVKDVEE